MPLAPVTRHLAFVSYAVEDNQGPGHRWAEWVADALETFAVPRPLAGRPTPLGPIPTRVAPVVLAKRKSEETLPADTQGALEQSRVLIVICSRAAARSAVVSEEVRYFKQKVRRPVIALIVEGEPDSAEAECFPESLKYEVRPDGTLDREWRLHPIPVDARPKSGTNVQQRLAGARHLLAAAVIGVPPEALPQSTTSLPKEGTPDRRRAPVAAWLAVLSLAATGVLGWYAYQAHEQVTAAKAARQRSDELIIFLQRNLREKLAPAGQLGALAEANERITEHLARVARESNDPAALSALADAFHDSAEILTQQGKHGPAVEAAQQAAQTRQRVAENPAAAADTPLRLIGDLRLSAVILLRANQASEALAVAEQSRSLAAALSRRRLGDPEAELTLANTHGLVADAFFALGRIPEAERAAESGRNAARQLAAVAPRDPAVQESFANNSERVARVKEKQGDLPAASKELSEWLHFLETQAAAAPNDLKMQLAFAVAETRMGNLLASRQQLPQAAQEYRKALDVFERVAKEQPTDKEAQRKLITACHQLTSVVANIPGSEMEALTYLRKGLDLLDLHFPGDTDFAATQARSDMQRLQKALMSKPGGQ